MTETNAKVAEHFNRLASYYSLSEDELRSNTFLRVSNIINALEVDITKINLNSFHIPGIGGSSIQEVKEFLKTGTSERLLQLEKENQVRAPDLTDLCRVPGVNIVEALEIWKNYGCVNVNELVQAITNGTVSDPSLMERVLTSFGPNTYVDRHLAMEASDRIIKWLEMFSYYEMYTYAGSIRRMKDKIKDIDMIWVPLPGICPDGKNTYPDLLKLMLAYEGYHFDWSGLQKVRVKVPLPDGSKIGCDILITTAQEYPCAVVYFTGSRELNIGMRRHAKTLNMSLNEHCISKLENGAWKILQPKTENEVFEILGLQYVEPQDRINESSLKKL